MKYIAVVLSLVAFAAPASTQEPRTVSVEGRSSTQVDPDVASTELGVLVRGANLEDVKNQTNQRIGTIFKELRSLGLEEDALRMSQIDLSLESPSDIAKEQVTRFEMYRQIRVDVTDLELLGAILDKAINAGSNQISGIYYGSSKEKEIKDKLLAEAIENAKAQAEQLAKGFGARLGKVVRIQSDRGGATANLSLVISTTSNPFGGETYKPGRIEIERSVSVVFELVD